jgi:hypothetical protein
MRVLHQDCDPSLANDRTLPYNCYLVSYKLDGRICYDLILTDKKIDIFDYYWDRYRNDFISFEQSEGRVNPRLWSNKSTEPKKKKK